MDLSTDSRAGFFASLLSPEGISWGWLIGLHLGLLSLFLAARVVRRVIKPKTFRWLLDFRFIREDPKFKWGNCLRMFGLMGPLLVAYVTVVLLYQWNPPFTLPVSVLLCVLFGLWVVINALFKVLNRAFRVLSFLTLLLVTFLSNGTDLKHSPDEFKLQLPNLSTSREPRPGENSTLVYDYYDKPEGLHSRSYLDRCYLNPVPVVNASNASPIVITSARAHGLRNGDHVRISGVWGNTNANGLFAIQTIPGSINTFQLRSSHGNGSYLYGGEWFEELGHGLVSRSTEEADGTIVITSPGHGLQDGDRIEMLDGRGSVGFHGTCPVAIRHDDARAADQFVLVGPKGEPGHRATWGGRWRRVSAVVHQGREGRPVQGGISWISTPRPGLFVAAPPITIESVGHGVLDGDHVLIEDVVVNTKANGVWTVAVDPGDHDNFTLIPDPPVGSTVVPWSATTEPASKKSRETLQPGREAAGKWRVVRDRGRVVGATNTKGMDIVISSPRHGLKAGQHVEITQVQGNTRANGIFTIGAVDHDSFSLAQAAPGTYDPNYNYISGGEWRLAPGMGRVVKVTVTAEGKVRVNSHAHHLNAETRVLVSGLDDPNLRDVNGIFAVEKINNDVFELVGARAATSGAMEHDYGNLGEHSEGQPTWRVALDSGGITKVTKPPGRPIVIHSTRHGLHSGDHVRIRGRRWATGFATYAVNADLEDPVNRFQLAETDGVRLEEGTEGGPSSTEEGPGGQWQVLHGVGGIVGVNLDPEGQIRVHSPRHHLKEGDRIQIDGLSWGRDKSRDIGLFTVAPKPEADAFSLRGTKNHMLLVNKSRVPNNPPDDPDEDDSKGGVKLPGVGVIGEWRFVFRPRDLEPVLITDSWPIEGGLRIESIGHGLQVGDCVRIENTWSAPKDRGPIAAAPTLSTQANGLFRVDSRDDDHFEIHFAVRPGQNAKPAKELDYFRGDWRPARDQGFVEGFAAEGPKGRVTSTRHGLADGARVLVEGTDRVSLVSVAAGDNDHFTLDPGGAVRNGGRWCVAGLLNDAELLANWEARQARDKLSKRDRAVAPTKPKLAIVAVSGGGIRSAIWTAKVLTQLESRIPEMPYHIRMITGASGGMLGAGSYVASLRPADQNGQARHSPSNDAIADHLQSDFLRPVANQLVFSDLPLMFYPATQHNDRGRLLEDAWTRPNQLADAGSRPGPEVPRPGRRRVGGVEALIGVYPDAGRGRPADLDQQRQSRLRPPEHRPRPAPGRDPSPLQELSAVAR